MKMSNDMQNCIDHCLRCYQICLGTAMTHCQGSGGRGRCAAALSAYDGLLRNVPYGRAFYASRFASPWARLRGVRRDMRRMRQGLRAHRRDGRLRGSM